MKVFIYVIEHRHGMDMDVYDTEGKRDNGVYEFVKENWDRIWLSDETKKAISELTAEAAIDFYFEAVGDEYLWREEREIK